MIDNKIFFMPGDIVTLKQDIPNKPIMIVVKKESSIIRPRNAESKDKALKGMKCRWFTSDGYLQECTFNTKDLVKIS